MLFCQFCNRECKNNNSHKNHERTCPNNENRKYKNGMSGKKGKNQFSKAKDDGMVIPPAWNKGLPGFFLGKKHSEKSKNLMSLAACKRLSNHSKYSKNTEYKPGVILESSYEVKTAEILDILEIKWEKVRQGYIWDDNGKQRRYIPDFYLPDYDIFLDPKNDYLILKDKVKIKSAMNINNIKVFVLSIREISIKHIQVLLLGVARGEQGRL